MNAVLSFSFIESLQKKKKKETIQAEQTKWNKNKKLLLLKISGFKSYPIEILFQRFINKHCIEIFKRSQLYNKPKSYDNLNLFRSIIKYK